MKEYTRLGISFLLTVFVTGMLWAQGFDAEIDTRVQAESASKDVIGDQTITDADVIAAVHPCQKTRLIA